MSERKKELGQFFTDPVIADYMAELAYFEGAETVLDPAVGKGIFIDAIQKKAPGRMRYSVYDIDGEMIAAIKAREISSVTAYQENYLLSDARQKYDIIISNPPYNRFQDIPMRGQYIDRFRNDFGLTLSGYSNLCVYFLVKSINELKDGGRCVYILPYEFLNTGYGTVIKRYLLERKMLKSIIKFDNRFRLFEDAVTTSCILVLENRSQREIEFITIRSMEEIRTKQHESFVCRAYSDLDPKEKWNRYFAEKQAESGRRFCSQARNPNQNRNLSGNLVCFGTVAAARRGIATGNNEFFALNRTMIREFGLSEQVCIPCVCKSPDIRTGVFGEAEFRRLAEQDKKVFLFDGSLAATEEDRAYIRIGEEKGVQNSYLTSHRNPWYAVEKKEAAPIWISVFSRNRLKIVRNEAGAKNLTTFHGIYPKRTDEEWVNLFFCYLLTPVAQEILYENKREYGDGLDKFEPNDLNHARVLDMECLSERDRAKVLEVYEKIRGSSLSQQHMDQLTEIFTGYIR